MTITEITVIAFKEPHTWGTASVRDFLDRLLPSQIAISGHPFYFFRPEGERVDETVIVTGWESVEAHLAWVRDIGVPLLGEYAGTLLELRGQVHLDVDFAQIPGDAKYVVWETHEDGEDGAGKAVVGSNWRTTGRILDEGQKGSCTLVAFGEKPEGSTDKKRVVLEKLNGDVV